VIGLDGLKTARAYLGHIAELAEVIAEMEPLVRRRDDRWYLPWAIFEGSFAAIAGGEWDEARERVGAALDASAHSGYPGHATWFLAHLGWIARLQGDLDGALEHGRRAVELGGPGAHPWWLSTARALLASTLLEAGEIRQARTEAGDALDAAGPHAVAACRLRCLAPLADAESRLASASERVPPSLLEADRLLTGITAPPGSAWLLGADAYLGVSRAWRSAERPDKARAALAPLVDAARRCGWRTLLPAASLIGSGGPTSTDAAVAQ
jgi:tetratricopeptide (TPR) repeat protein